MSLDITIPLSRLSLDPQQRHAQLRDYFCDKDAVAAQIGDQWALVLGWSDDPHRYVDPQLDKGLAWWGSHLRYQDMALARKRRGRLLLSLNDTWTLESWSEWLASNPQHPHITVLHVDDHKDLGAPRIFQRADGWFDPITGQTFSLQHPSSVTNAIKSGALGMGSFLTPFLHYAPDTDVRHLCQGPKCVGTVDSTIKLEFLPDTLLNPDERRPWISLIPDDKNVEHGRYRFTNDLEAWLEGLSSAAGKDTAILLHIDMDYFCNRYDGDSDFIEHPGPLDCSLPEVLTRVDELTQSLHRHHIVDRLANIVIAFSPGFFPAEFWAKSCDRLLAGLGESL
ncbi:hypothetical protein [Aeromonas caviae]|uniref:hypothetical protein n=1 Tax=Aeromonas caviae TaxID=648 RepID=UPI002B4A93FD|nr:hypothetical protein [Aeromonas caviae]